MGSQPPANAREELGKMYQASLEQARHHENQRSTVVGLVLAIATGLVGDRHVRRADCVAGRFRHRRGSDWHGLVWRRFFQKHSERFRLYMRRARGYQDALDELLPGRPLRKIDREADQGHFITSGSLGRSPVSLWWMLLCLALSVMGSGLLVISIWFPVMKPS